MSTSAAAKPILITGFSILVTKASMERLSNPAMAAAGKKAVERAMGFAEGVDFTEPRTVMIPNNPFCVHVDPQRLQVFIMSKFPGWPAVTDNLIDELTPLCEVVSLA